MLDWHVALPPRVAAAVRRCRPRLAATLLRGPWGGWTWLAAPAGVVAARGAPGAPQRAVGGGVGCCARGARSDVASLAVGSGTGPAGARAPGPRANPNALQRPRATASGPGNGAGRRPSEDRPGRGPCAGDATRNRWPRPCSREGAVPTTHGRPGRSGWAGSREGWLITPKTSTPAGRVAQLETSLRDVLIDPASALHRVAVSTAS